MPQPVPQCCPEARPTWSTGLCGEPRTAQVVAAEAAAAAGLPDLLIQAEGLFPQH